MKTASCSSKKGRPCKLSERQKRIKAKRQVNTFKDRTEGEPNPTLCFRITGGDYLGNRKFYRDNRQASWQGIFYACCYLQKRVFQEYNIYHSYGSSF